MKATIEFNLPEDQEEYKICMEAGRMHSVLWDFSNYLRNKYKHEEAGSTEAWVEFQEIKGRFHLIMDENDLEL